MTIDSGDPDLDVYLNLITSLHNQQPRFMQTVALSVQPAADALRVARPLPTLFDIDTAVGRALDMTGEWIGISRRIGVVADGEFFSLDIPGLGLDQGYWYGPEAERGGFVIVPDEEYRLILKTRILSNHWNGLRETAYAVWDFYFGAKGFGTFLFDNYQQGRGWFTWDDPHPAMGWEAGFWDGTDPAEIHPATGTMWMDVILYGHPHTAFELALFSGGFFDVRPAGVGIRYWQNDDDYPGMPIFAWDEGPTAAQYDSGTWTFGPLPMAGWDIGHWMLQVEPPRTWSPPQQQRLELFNEQ